MNVDPGSLNKRISIVRKVKTADDDGHYSYSYETVHSCSARFTRKSAKEIYEANADFSETEVRFLIRYTSKSIDRKMLVLYAGKYYEIIYVNDYSDSRKYMELQAKLISTEATI